MTITLLTKPNGWHYQHSRRSESVDNTPPLIQSDVYPINSPNLKSWSHDSNHAHFGGKFLCGRVVADVCQCTKFETYFCGQGATASQNRFWTFT